METIVSAPADLVIAVSDGIDVRFAGVELTAHLPPFAGAVPGERGIKIYLDVGRSLETQLRDQRHGEEMENWAEKRKLLGPEGAGAPPNMPGQLVLDPVRANIYDDAGTDYRWAAGQVAGTGTDWDGSWTYLPGPPQRAKFLTLEFTLNGTPTGTTCQVQLD